MTYFNYSFF